MDDRTPVSPEEFQPIPLAFGLKALGLGLVALGAVIFAIGLGLTDGTVQVLVLVTSFLACAAGGVVLQYSVWRTAGVHMTEEGIVVRHWGRTEIYDWRDINYVQLDPAQPRRLVRVPAESTVKLHLTRTLKDNLLTGRRGTRVFGLPTGQRSVQLRVAEPEAFLSAVRVHQQATSANRTTSDAT